VQRGGPSTGQPTKAEQSDLLAAVYGSHGDAPKVVMAASGIEDCFYSVITARKIAETFNTVVVLLSDASLATAQQDIHEIVELGSGRLAIGGAGLVGTYLLPKALSMFKAIYPKLDIYMNYASATAIEHLLREDAIELGMFSREPRIRGLSSEPYAVSEMIIAAPPRHPLARKRRVSIEEVAAEPFVMREPQSSGTEIVRQFFKDRGFEIKLAMEVSGHESLKVAVAEGLGVSAIGRRWIDNEVALGQIALLNAPDFKLHIHHRIVQREGRPLSQAAKTFLQFLRDRKRELSRLVA